MQNAVERTKKINKIIFQNTDIIAENILYPLSREYDDLWTEYTEAIKKYAKTHKFRITPALEHKDEYLLLEDFFPTVAQLSQKKRTDTDMTEAIRKYAKTHKFRITPEIEHKDEYLLLEDFFPTVAPLSQKKRTDTDM